MMHITPDNKTIFQVCINLNDDIQELQTSRKKLLELNPGWRHVYVQSQEQLDQLMIVNFKNSNDKFEKDIYQLYSELPDIIVTTRKGQRNHDLVEREKVRLVAVLVSRTDVFRHAMLYKFGGLYFDLSSRVEEDLDYMFADYDCCFFRSPSEVNSSIVYAKKNHPVTRKILERAIYVGLVERNPNQMVLAGPGCLTRVIDDILTDKELVESRTKLFYEDKLVRSGVNFISQACWKSDLHKQSKNNPNKIINTHWLVDDEHL